MKNAKSMYAWVTQTDVSEWAKKYLLSKFGHPAAQARYEQLRLISTLKGCSEENRELLDSMKVAWRKQKSRQKPRDTKPHNFELSKNFDRQLSKLVAILGETKAHTLELIVNDRVELENQYKLKRKEESAYKKRADLFERELNRALNELFEYKLRLSEAKVDTSTRLNSKQKDEIKRAFRARKSEVIKALPPLPENVPKKIKQPTLKKAGAQRSKTQTSSASAPSISALQQTKEPGQIASSQEQAGPLQDMPSNADGELSPSAASGLTKNLDDAIETQ